MGKRGYPWPQCIAIGVAGALVIAWITNALYKTGLSVGLVRSFTENAALIALFVRYVSESRDNSPERLFRVMAVAGLIILANRLLFMAVERVL